MPNVKDTYINLEFQNLPRNSRLHLAALNIGYPPDSVKAALLVHTMARGQPLSATVVAPRAPHNAFQKKLSVLLTVCLRNPFVQGFPDPDDLA